MSPPTLLVSRPLPGPGAALLKQVNESGQAKVIQWEKDSLAPRDWILDNLKKEKVDGVVITMGDKVSFRPGGVGQIAVTLAGGGVHLNLTEEPRLGRRGVPS